MLNKLKYSVVLLLAGNGVLLLLYLAYPHATELWKNSINGDEDRNQFITVSPRPKDRHQGSVSLMINENNATSFNRNLLSVPKKRSSPTTDKSTCEAPCLNALSFLGKKRYNFCMNRVRNFGITDVKENGCRFLNQTGREKVALASYAGSGNTWVRGVLEQVTSVCTGASMCDMSLRAGGFTGEGVDTPSVLVVKTHYSALDSWSEMACDSVIVIVRNPLNALVSEFNRLVANNFSVRTIKLGTHTKKAGKEYFRENQKWKSFLKHKMPIWRNTIENWVIAGIKTNHRVLVVRYEDLKEHQLEQVKRMLDFLNFPYKDEQLKARLAMEYGAYHREHTTEQFDPFTAEQRRNVLFVIKKTQQTLQNNHLSHVVKLGDYLEQT